MNRRQSIRSLLALGALASFRAAGQVPPRSVRVAQAWAASESAVKSWENALLAGLRSLGYERGRNLTYDVGYADGNVARLGPIIDELLSRKPDAFVGIGQVIAVAFPRTTTIPLIMVGGGDPVEFGYAKSLARPGGRVTGLVSPFDQLTGKWVELLLETVPTMRRIAMLNDQSSPSAKSVDRFFEAAARVKKLTPRIYYATGRNELEAAFDQMNRDRPDGLLINATGATNAHRDFISQTCKKLRIPALSNFEGLTEAGTLMSYNATLRSAFTQAARFVDRIARGARPADIPFEFPTIYSLIINVQTASALGIKIPSAILARADEVIQ